LIVIISIVILERFWLSREIFKKKVIYNNLDHVNTQNHEILKNELEQKLGLVIQRVKVNDVDFFQNTAKLTIYHFENKD